MNDIVAFMQNVDAAAFVLLGVAVGITWLRNRDRSTGWLALAIVLLSLVIAAGRVPALLHFTPPLPSQLSLGFAGLVALLLFLIALLGAGARTTSPGVQLGTQLVVLAMVPLLYVSFSPPSWLRREWRAGEEEGLRQYMENLVVISEETEA